MEPQHYARVLDGVVAEPPIAFDPEGFYAPEVLATFVPCPPETRQGATFNPATGSFANPPEPEPVEPPPPAEPAYRTRVSRVEYYGLFRPDEEALIRITASEPVTAPALKAADPTERARLMAVASLAVMLRRTDGRVAGAMIDLANDQVGDGLALVVQLGCITPDRPAEIRRGVPV